MMDLVSLLDLEGWIAAIVNSGARAMGVIVVGALIAWTLIPQSWAECVTSALEQFACA